MTDRASVLPEGDSDQRVAGDRNGLPTAARDGLTHLNRLALLGRSVAGLAHALNNPLQVIGGLGELLGAARELPPDLRAKADKIGLHVAQAAAAIREVVAFGRDVAAERSPLDLGATVEAALALRRYPLARAGIAVETHAPGGNPCRVVANRPQMQQVVLNLLINAEDALTGREGARVRIEIWRADGGIHLSIRDNGPGVSDEARAHLFEPFFTTKPANEAAGIGLWVAATLVRQHGGRLRLDDSAVDGGATFVVELPECLAGC